MIKRYLTSASAVFLFAAINTTSIQAASPTEELLSLTNVQGTLNHTFDSILPMYKQQAIQLVQQHTGHTSFTARDQQAVERITQSMLTNSQAYLQRMNIMQSIQGVYATYYTDQEIQAYVKFLKSPEGRSIMSKQNQLNTAVEQQIAMAISTVAKSPGFQQKIAQDTQTILAELPRR
ncbi:DUF2059 domain-containing protein [Acinetobacter nectaris]|uniref:DUF2059 domain-containing protein n=1 Tax=Acinetobacter nectaris TaxID=1219382 RepID=UPI001F2E21C5|nr:DUF2059 domain-containing protein [Acinetobacter nectaris]MCF9033434.1 DUF2059 domain-containing protein [Acinetobacter nectaris]